MLLFAGEFVTAASTVAHAVVANVTFGAVLLRIAFAAAAAAAASLLVFFVFAALLALLSLLGAAYEQVSFLASFLFVAAVTCEPQRQ